MTDPHTQGIHPCPIMLSGPREMSVTVLLVSVELKFHKIPPPFIALNNDELNYADSWFSLCYFSSHKIVTITHTASVT